MSVGRREAGRSSPGMRTRGRHSDGNALPEGYETCSQNLIECEEAKSPLDLGKPPWPPVARTACMTKLYAMEDGGALHERADWVVTNNEAGVPFQSWMGGDRGTPRAMVILMSRKWSSNAYRSIAL